MLCAGPQVLTLPGQLPICLMLFHFSLPPTPPLRIKLKCTVRWTSKPVNIEVSCLEITFVICLHFAWSPFLLGSLRVFCPSSHPQIPLQPVDPLYTLKRRMRKKSLVQIFSPGSATDLEPYDLGQMTSLFRAITSHSLQNEGCSTGAVKAAWDHRCDDGT